MSATVQLVFQDRMLTCHVLKSNEGWINLSVSKFHRLNPININPGLIAYNYVTISSLLSKYIHLSSKKSVTVGKGKELVQGSLR